MKKLIIFTVLLTLLISTQVHAEESQLNKIRCTCYTASEGAITADGSNVREGIIAGKREWLGYTAVLYDLDMNFIGIYEFKDTGNGIDTDGDGVGDSIKKGLSVDIYRDTLERCYDWINQYGDYVYIQIIKVEG